MTEMEWAICEQPLEMLGHVGKGSEFVSLSQLRFFRAASIRLVQDCVNDAAKEEWLNGHEEYAEDRITEDGLKQMLLYPARGAAGGNSAPDIARNLLLSPPFDDFDHYHACRNMYDVVSGTLDVLFQVSARNRVSRIVFDSTLERRYPASLVQANPAGVPEHVRIYYRRQEEEYRLYNAESARLSQAARKRVCDVLRDVVYPFPHGDYSEWHSDRVLSLAREISATREYGRMAELGELLEDEGCGDTRLLLHCMSPTHAHGCHVLRGLAADG